MAQESRRNCFFSGRVLCRETANHGGIVVLAVDLIGHIPFLVVVVAV